MHYLKINIIYFSVIALLFVIGVNAQLTIVPRYQIIPQVMSMDTLPDEYFALGLHMKIKSGKISKEDSIKSMLRWSKEPLVLLRRAINRSAQERLAKQYLDNEEIAKYLGREPLLAIVEKIPPDQNHPDELATNKITVVAEKPKHETHHYFSSPFFIEEGRYIIYHSKVVAFGLGKVEFLIFCIKTDGSIEIEKTFVLWEHGTK